MFLYFQGDNIKLSLQKMDEQGNQLYVIFQTMLVMNEQKEYSYKQFIEMLVHPVLSVLSRRSEPRMSEEIRKFLQLSNQVQIGDWYLYQNYTELKIFGCEIPPYKLPKFLPMRIFALEYIKQMFNMDECQEEVPIQNQNTNCTFHLQQQGKTQINH